LILQSTAWPVIGLAYNDSAASSSIEADARVHGTNGGSTCLKSCDLPAALARLLTA
jgi:hypothetical protein